MAKGKSEAEVVLDQAYARIVEYVHEQVLPGDNSLFDINTPGVFAHNCGFCGDDAGSVGDAWNHMDVRTRFKGSTMRDITVTVCRSCDFNLEVLKNLIAEDALWEFFIGNDLSSLTNRDKPIKSFTQEHQTWVSSVVHVIKKNHLFFSERMVPLYDSGILPKWWQKFGYYGPFHHNCLLCFDKILAQDTREDSPRKIYQKPILPVLLPVEASDMHYSRYNGGKAYCCDKCSDWLTDGAVYYDTIRQATHIDNHYINYELHVCPNDGELYPVGLNEETARRKAYESLGGFGKDYNRQYIGPCCYDRDRTEVATCKCGNSIVIDKAYRGPNWDERQYYCGKCGDTKAQVISQTVPEYDDWTVEVYKLLDEKRWHWNLLHNGLTTENDIAEILQAKSVLTYKGVDMAYLAALESLETYFKTSKWVNCKPSDTRQVELWNKYR